MKRHVIVCLALLLGVGLALAGDSAAQDKPIVLKWGHSYPPDHPSNVGAKKMAEVVAARAPSATSRTSSSNSSSAT